MPNYRSIYLSVSTVFIFVLVWVRHSAPPLLYCQECRAPFLLSRKAPHIISGIGIQKMDISVKIVSGVEHSGIPDTI
jgi:hypothetical protein